ncbi:MAG: DUF368 domain-containing protein [Bacteroidota bacterium]
MQNKRNLTDSIFLFLKGLAMGAANKVPGVSGGVVAFVAGFYEEFIYSLQKFNLKAFHLLFKRGGKVFLEYINFKFIGVLILGMTVSYFSVSKILDYFIEQYELYVWAAFFGMIIGSIYYMARDFNLKSFKNLLFIFIGTSAGITISFMSPATENDNLWFVFLCGIISVSGMTLPGLSGSFILILLGNYVLLLVDSVNALFDTLTEIIRLDFSFSENPKRIQLLKVLSSFTAGSVFGLVSLSHLLGYVLKYFKKMTFLVIIGFITGSLGVVWPWKKPLYKKNANGEILYDANENPVLDNYIRYWPDLSDTNNWLAILFIFLGIIVVLSLIWLGKRKRYKNA